jgi:acyl transferase domain-containing protein/acyl carrier protein
MSNFRERLEGLSQKRLMLLALDLHSQLEELQGQKAEPIAIIGLGCRVPGGEGGPDAFWQLLEEGRSSICEVPADRWDAEAYYDSNLDTPGRMSTKWGGFLSHIDEFDAQFFGIAGREANGMDPQHRMLLEVCWEALEHGGHSPRKLAGSATGVFVGLSASDYQTMLLAMGGDAIDGYLASGTSASIAAGRISYTLGLHGPSMAIDTACSASLVAVHLACQSLRTRECSMALAGGVNAMLSPATTIALSKAHMMSPDGRCKTFDSHADGFVRSEGCGIVLLKRLSDAVADRDHILALIRGSAVNQDGRSSGMTAPNGVAQEGVIRSALSQAGVQPEQIDYVEAHGTGTSLGDPIEAHALAAALGPGRGVENPLVVGSVKTNLGHMESAAGVVGLIKVVLALRHEMIPPHLHFKQLNPHIDWGTVPVEIPLEGRSWLRGERRRLAGVSSFGFSGTNAHVILEEAPEAGKRKTIPERGQHILTLSARNGAALRQLNELYAAALVHENLDVADFCYTANAGRAHFEHRLAVVGSTREELRQRLLDATPGISEGARARVAPVFLFPGQGAQYAGMGRELYEEQPVFRAALEECAAGLDRELNRSLLDVLWGDEANLLNETLYTQPALFAVEYSLARMWQSWGIEPSAVAGHSVGEYVAACFAGVYSLADGLRLIAGRARLMQEVSGAGGMVAVWATEDRVREFLRGFEERVVIAAINGPESVVVSGYIEELEKVEQRLRDQGIQTQRLRTSHGFHSPQMRAMEDAFEALAAQVLFAPPRMQVISSVTGQPVAPEEMSHPSYWRRQVSQPVRFRQVMECLRDHGSQVFLEVGPGTTLGFLGKECIGRAEQMWLPSMRRGQRDCTQALESLAALYMRGAEVDWEAFDRPYARRRVPLPTYPFQRRRYWVDGARFPGSPASAAEDAHEVRDRSLEDTSPADWYYEVSWQQQTAGGKSSKGVARCCLIVSEGGDLATGLADRIRQLGDEAILANSPDAIGAALLDKQFDLLLHVAAGNGSGLADREGAPSIAVAGSCISMLLETAKAILSKEQNARLWIVTAGAQSVAHQTSVNLEHAPLWGFGRTFALEHPGSWGGLVDLDPNASISEHVSGVLSAIERSDGEDQVAFRNDKRYVARLKRILVPSGADPSFSPDKSYLITGGLGGLGLETAAWMAGRGARTLIMLGRNAPSQSAAEAIEVLRRDGVRVEIFAVDAGSMAQMNEVFRRIQETLPALGGVIHAAGILDDGIIAQQKWERFQKVMVPKVNGAWNLHRLTEGMPLDFFVLFSSTASLIGSAGQASYSAANAYLDALAHQRRARGLPALSINWGGWANTGMAARATNQSRRQTEFQLMLPDRALAALGQVLFTASAQIGIAAIDWAMHESLHGSQPFFCDLPAKTAEVSVAGQGVRQTREQQLHELLSAPSDKRHNLLIGNLVETLAPTLGVETHTINPSSPVTDYGLDSLMALEFRNRINSDFKVSIPAVQFLQGLSLEEVAARIERELPDTIAHESCVAVPFQELEFPLSIGQQQRWFGHKFMPGSAPNNIGLAARARPCLDWPAFERAVAKLIGRHAVLRTVFFENDLGIPMQRILPSPRPEAVLIDASSLSDEEIKERILHDFRQPLALDKPMFQASVYRRGTEDVLFLKLDHIILDHWSVGLCVEDLRKIYAAELTGSPPDLAPLKGEYWEFVEWESNFVNGAESSKLWEYWRRKLAGELPVLKLPSSRERPAILVSSGRAIPLSLTPEHWVSIQQVSREYRATGYSILLAVFQVLLYLYTEQTDIVIGTSVSGREDPRWANTVGLFINVLPLRSDLSGNPRFSDYLIRSRDTVWEALEHQAFPLSLMLTRIRQRRSLERIPIFQAFFNFLTDRSGALRPLFMGVQDRSVDFGRSMLHYFMVVPQQEGRLEISIQVAEVDGQLIGFLNYNSDILDADVADMMASDYCRLLDTLIRDPHMPIDDFQMGSASACEEIVF